MKHWISAMHFFSYAALWAAVAGYLLQLFTAVSDPLPLVFLVGLAAGIASLLENRGNARFLGACPVLLSFVFCRTAGDFLVTLPLVGYLLLCVYKKAMFPTVNETVSRFRLLAAVSLVTGVLAAWKGLSWCFIGSCLFLCTAVFVMRMLRHVEENTLSRRLMLLESLVLLLLVAVCIGLSQPAVLEATGTLLGWGYTYLLTPIFFLLSGIFFCIIWLILQILRPLLPEPAQNVLEEMQVQGTDTIEKAAAEITDVADGTVLSVVLQALGVLVFLFVAFLLFRKLYRSMHSGSVTLRDEGDSHRLSDTDAWTEIRTPGRLDRSPNARVRRAYAAYYKAVDAYCVQLSREDTTRSVNRHAAKTVNAEEAERLRQLYLRARYTQHGALTRAEAKEASALSKKLRQKLEIKPE